MKYNHAMQRRGRRVSRAASVASVLLLLVLVQLALVACSVLNGYEPLPSATGGAGGVGEGGASTGGGGADSGTGGELPTCNQAACEAGSGNCVTCTCLQGLVCDCDPVPDGATCRDGVCAGGACVDCLTNADCRQANELCDQNKCVGASCNDGVHNGQETDIDCGGVDCAPCANGDSCDVPEDCTSVHCATDVCLPCDQQADCGDFLYCDLNEATCVPQKSQFQLCVEDYECASGMCEPFGSFMVCS